MGKIDLFKENFHIGDRVVIYRNLTMLTEVIRQTGVTIINGPLEDTFEKCLRFTSYGKGYINEQNVPSTGI